MLEIVSWRRAARRIGPQEAGRLEADLAPETLLFHFHVSAMQVEPHAGAFSLKLVLSGAERYEVDGRSVWLRPGEVMLVNSSARYGSEIVEPTEAVSMFIPSDALRTMCLDEPETPFAPWRPSARTAAKISRMRHELSRTSDDTAETAISVLTGVLTDWSATHADTVLQTARAATRDELFRRLARARDMIHDLEGRGCELARLAQVACMAPHHFLRRFAQAYGETPGAYARRLRLQTAHSLVQAGKGRARALEAAGYARSSSLTRAMKRSRNCDFRA